ncbi:NAD/NADP octopine/nopaline dehydrogenase family protein [Crassaminicella profunda]|uniref:NAD/NADP octopine/nopaline dehydrogenase family protein n=1 Tax=Crassaminicella profunda TaxID=1286698 RepID=UPI001CA6E354|nr:NAD/NADP octopine/nopaline dehydrogenase family protein [Crassaminicella profunda]QZY54346.1 NAD/NADP octopine/nopaline dehydrogenase family protein [Crassaminicella profunda]
MKEKLFRKLKFAVIGAGHGGQGIAGYLAYKGYKVNLYNRTIEKIKEIKQKGYIDLVGAVVGRGRLNLVTNSIEKAIKNVDVIMVVLPASAHKFIANHMAPFVTQEQYIVLNPGRTGGALEFKSIIGRHNPLKKVCIVEAQTLLFACRAQEPGKVKIFSKKEEVKVATLPAVRNNQFIHTVHEVFPEFTPALSVLETSFNNVGALLHPIPTILNCGRIENTKGNFRYYIDGITPAVAKIIEQVDHERMQVARVLGVKVMSLTEWLGYTYNAYGNTLCEALKNAKGYLGIKAPMDLNTRYIHEDVPQSLVPIWDMANHLNIQTPTIQAMIHLASILHHTDYYKNGRKVIDMGLEGLSIEEIKAFVMNDQVSDSRGVVA